MERSFAVLTDVHAAAASTPDGVWNNPTLYSRSLELLDLAVRGITDAGHTTVVLLGDIAQHGDFEYVDRVLRTLADAGLTVLAVAGNHDVAWSASTVELAAAGIDGVTVPGPTAAPLLSGVPLGGQPISSEDGGRTCTATALPDPPADGLHVWATHYPVLSRAAALADAGLRYPGDLLNLDEVAAPLLGRSAPTLVLHGHLHTATVEARGPLLQLGFPALVEWPHAWTSAVLTVGGEVAVRTQQHSVAPDLPHPHNTVLAAEQQSWSYTDGAWRADA